MSFRMTLSDLEWVNKIFNDTKHPAVSLRQLSFLYLGMYFMFYGNAIKHRLDSAVPPTVVTECIVRFFLILVLSGSYSSRTTAFKCFYSNTTEHLCSLLTVHSSHRFGWSVSRAAGMDVCLEGQVDVDDGSAVAQERFIVPAGWLAPRYIRQ